MSMSPNLSKFCAYWNGRTPGIAIRNAVKKVFPDLATLPLPIDVHALAKRRGVREVIYTDLDTDGRISLSPSGSYIVFINHSQTDARQRFTLAHEIGHTLFFEAIGHAGSDSERTGTSCYRDAEEERLCDFVATEILMPQKQMDGLVKRHGFSASAIVEASQRCRSSLRSAAKRIISIAPLRLAACMWEQDLNSQIYLASWSEGISRASHTDRDPLFVSPEQPAFKIFSAGENFRGRFWISLGGPLDHYFIDGYWLAGKTRRLLTTIGLDRQASILFPTNKARPTSDSEQQTLF
jgi:hypothetical protein